MVLAVAGGMDGQTGSSAVEILSRTIGRVYFMWLETPEGKARLTRAIEDNWPAIAAAVRSAGGAFMGDEEAR